MARIEAILLFSVLVLLLSLPISQSSKKPVAVARKEDIPFIKCQVCQKLAHQLHHQVNAKQSQISPKKLVEQDTEGQCNSECKTIERACQEVMGYYDTDVAEYLYTTKPQIDSLVNFLCNDLSRACSVKPTPVPKDRIPGEPFLPKSSKDAEMEKILRSMEGMPGAPNMKMYSKDDLLNMENVGEEDADEEGDEDDEHFPSKLGKVLREQESQNTDWKQRIVEGIRGTGEEIKRHVNKASQQIQKWWRGRKTGSKASKAEL
eukprot:TRINITY_DN988_c0_g1_i3.p1 TRINITY_DN988_c0_g1~~TRINITY_DN988_c0_g1_i3.p1  ORF type:complete len:261 (+),score=67.43 TRINITY_DN988_c0_g1_i3:115-897(+)